MYLLKLVFNYKQRLVFNYLRPPLLYSDVMYLLKLVFNYKQEIETTIIILRCDVLVKTSI